MTCCECSDSVSSSCRRSTIVLLLVQRLIASWRRTRRRLCRRCATIAVLSLVHALTHTHTLTHTLARSLTLSISLSHTHSLTLTLAHAPAISFQFRSFTRSSPVTDRPSKRGWTDKTRSSPRPPPAPRCWRRRCQRCSRRRCRRKHQVLLGYVIGVLLKPTSIVSVCVCASVRMSVCLYVGR